MFQQKPVSEAMISPGVPKLLQEGYYVEFTKVWPAEFSHLSGRIFQIAETNVVPHDIHHIIPTNDYRDVDFSNNAGGENLYPEGHNTLYELVVGFKPGNYLAQVFIPAGENISRLEQPGMFPDVTNVVRRYLGQRTPVDSPYDDRRIFIYTVRNLEPMIFRMFVDTGIDFDKVVIGITVNKCRMAQIASPTPEQRRLAKLIRYYSELRW